MTYKAEAVIPLETGFPTLKTSSFNPSDNNGLLEKSLDFIKEMRENAMVQFAYYQHKVSVRGSVGSVFFQICYRTDRNRFCNN